ncbi:hypothetical protein Goshw_008837 [Gossypium schwendimanii]|uniref:DUF7745 domain-containing protein n=1 Tax=Gossypium schwendimanii TaxID=34291 RepID=A0A7J9NEV3_GOSSC|nr:hypothetical protein [Gossypium schwendimanii]
MALLHCSKIQADKKGDSKCIPWKNLKDLILAYPDTKKKVDVFALSVYGLVVFPKALGHVDEVVTNLFDRFDKRVTPVPTILAETFRSLNEYRRVGDGYKKKIREMSNAWNQTRRMKRLAVGPITTPKYSSGGVGGLMIISPGQVRETVSQQKNICEMSPLS